MVRRWLDPGPLATIDKAPKMGPVTMGHALEQCGESQHQTVAESQINALCTTHTTPTAE